MSRLLAGLLCAAGLTLSSACSTTPGAPGEDELSYPESAEEAMEEEAAEDAWRDMNR